MSWVLHRNFVCENGENRVVRQYKCLIMKTVDTILLIVIFAGLFFTSLFGANPSQNQLIEQNRIQVITGLENLLQNHTEKIQGKCLGIVTNHTGVDDYGVPNWIRLRELQNVKVIALFSPEHGLSGQFQAGEIVLNNEFSKEPIKVYSLYGKTKKPTPDMLKEIEILLYDIQDIGTRFYTYITTLGLILEAAGENNIPVLILDRPNPITGIHISGPVLEEHLKSFVGYYPIPVQYGLTVGELATMIINEKWITSYPEIEIIPLLNWERALWYDETTLRWVKTSPNIPDLTTALVYSGTCFLEATNISEGRGTPHPFLWIGSPWINGEQLSYSMNKHNLPGVLFESINFTPSIKEKVNIYCKYQNEECKGIEINITNRNVFNSVEMGIFLLTTLNYLYPDKLQINPDRMNRLFGTEILTEGLMNKTHPKDIINQYKSTLENFKKIRIKYLLY